MPGIPEQYHEIEKILDSWRNDNGNLKESFVELRDKLISKEDTFLAFKSRPGVSHSLRAGIEIRSNKKNRLFALVDIIDDDPDNRWLSVCFYDGTITDNEGFGNLIPEGILGEDGYCFDLFENDGEMVSFLKEKIDEAHASIMISMNL